jgi:hypothetical protein
MEIIVPIIAIEKLILPIASFLIIKLFNKTIIINDNFL